MWHTGGLGPFLKGTQATLYREIAYGSTYEVLRHLLRKKFTDQNAKKQKASFNLFTAEFTCNLTAAGVSTVVSSPWNFARNIQYASESADKAPKISAILNQLWNESSKQVGKGFGRAGFFVHTLKIGWGTLGTAIKMGIGQFAFDQTKELLHSDNTRENTNTLTPRKS